MDHAAHGVKVNHAAHGVKVDHAAHGVIVKVTRFARSERVREGVGVTGKWLLCSECFDGGT